MGSYIVKRPAPYPNVGCVWIHQKREHPGPTFRDTNPSVAWTVSQSTLTSQEPQYELFDSRNRRMVERWAEQRWPTITGWRRVGRNQFAAEVNDG